MVYWVYDIVTEAATNMVVATVFHTHENGGEFHPACCSHIAVKLGLEGNRYTLSKQFNTLKEAQAYWYKETKQTDMIKGLD